MKNPTRTRERMQQGQVSWYRLGEGEALITFSSGKLLPHIQACNKCAQLIIKK